jgi:hypothetical protein
MRRKTHEILHGRDPLGHAVRPGAKDAVMGGDQQVAFIGAIDGKAVDMGVLFQFLHGHDFAGRCEGRRGQRQPAMPSAERR